MSTNVPHCPGCSAPAHASETDDSGCHPQCRQPIPIIDEHTAALVALFNAALLASPYSLTISERVQPGAGAALISWARQHGLRAVERRFVTETDTYANINVQFGADSTITDSTITVLAYRKLTADEIAAITVETREHKQERLGWAESPL